MCPRANATANTRATTTTTTATHNATMTVLLLVATLVLTTLNTSTFPIVMVSASWHSEMCHVGPRYKVKLDSVTGKVVPVYPEHPFAASDKNAADSGGLTSGGVFYATGNPFSDNAPSTINRAEDEATANVETEAEDPIPENNVAESSERDNADTDTDASNAPDGSVANDALLNDGAVRRVLRSSRFWRDVDEDSGMDALVVSNHKDDDDDEKDNHKNWIANNLHSIFGIGSKSANRNDANTDASLVEADPSVAASFGRKLESVPGFQQITIDDDLKEGEFYVKPCLCQKSRWTFPEDAGLNTKAVYDDTTDTIIQTPPLNLFDGQINQYTAPNSFGRNTNGQFTYVPDNLPDADMYLCNVQAMYCGMDASHSFNGVGYGTANNYEDATNLYGGGIDGGGGGVLLGHRTVMCYEQNMKHVIARNAWPLILLWYFGLAIICCCTVHGRTAGDYLQDMLTQGVKKVLTILCGCCWKPSYDFNERMLERMLDDDNRELRQRRRNNRRNNSVDGVNNDDDDDEDSTTHRPWCYSSQRRQFERSLLTQVQWIWRHQEYMREAALREQGLPPPQLKLKIKRFKMETSTSVSREGGFAATVDPKEELDPELKLHDKDKKERRASNSSGSGIASRRASNSSGGGTGGRQSRRASNDTTCSRRSSNGSQRSRRSRRRNAAEPRASNDEAAPASASVEPQETSTEATATSTSGEASAATTASQILLDDTQDNASCTICPSDSKDDDEFVTLDVGPDAEDGEDAGASKTDAADNDHICIVIDEDDDDDMDSLDAPTCTICFCPFEEGDRIGDLTCKHEFHVDCLKGWVQRKNSCPLCNVRLGRPERPPLPRESTATTATGTEEATDTGGSNRSLRERIRRSFRRSGSNSNSNSNSASNEGAGEIQRGSRMGMIGAISTAEDMSAAAAQSARRARNFTEDIAARQSARRARDEQERRARNGQE